MMESLERRARRAAVRSRANLGAALPWLCLAAWAPTRAAAASDEAARGAPPAATITTRQGHTLTRLFAGQFVGAEGTVVACADEGVEFVVPALERAPSQPRPEEGERQARALAVACQAAERLHASRAQVFVPIRQRHEVAHFLLEKNGAVLFGKAVLPAEAALTWPEPAYARRAAQAGWAPPMVEAPGMPHVLVSVRLPALPIGRVASHGPACRRQILARLREVHASEPAEAPSEPPRPVGASWARVDDLLAGALEGPLPAAALRQRLAAIDAELARLPVTYAPCHGDAAVGNMLWHEGAVWLVDWEAAGWDDPYRDVARLASNSQWPHASLPRALAEYLERSPTAEELRHLALLVAAFDIDHYGAARVAHGPVHPSVLRFAARVASPPTGDVELPPVVPLPADGHRPWPRAARE